MMTPPPQSTNTEREALESLVVDNDDLEKLESLLDQFNIFEAIGMVRQEIRHSHFLAFLLDPTKSHGFDDSVLKKLLQDVLTKTPDATHPISLIDLDVWDLNDTTVLRETDDIDLLALNATEKLAVIIENKIDSDEHSDQLKRYWDLIEHRHAGWSIIGLYLTRDGDLPTDDRYLPVSYGAVAAILEILLSRRSSVTGQDVKTLISHYVQMLRRHIVTGSEIDDLCNRIYKKHRLALDLIFERRPDRQADLKANIVDLIRKTPGFIIDKDTKTSIKFLPDTWNVPALKQRTQWSSNGYIMMFEFVNKVNDVLLILQIGPGDMSIRQKLYDLAKRTNHPFKPGKTLSPDFGRLYTLRILSTKELEEWDTSDLVAKIEEAWQTFLTGDFLKIEQALKTEGLI